MEMITTSLTSAVSDTAYTYSNPVDLTKDRYSGKQVIIKADISGSAVSAVVDINLLWAESYGATYTAFLTQTGTSKIIASGTSVSGLMANGSYLVPVYFANALGVTTPFLACGWLKVGGKANKYDAPVSVKVVMS